MSARDVCVHQKGSFFFCLFLVTEIIGVAVNIILPLHSKDMK